MIYTHTIPEMRDAPWTENIAILHPNGSSVRVIRLARSGSDPMMSPDEEIMLAQYREIERLTSVQSQPAPPVPSSVQEIMRRMNPYVRACVECATKFPAGVLDGAEAITTKAFKPLEAALTALVDERDRLKFELAGVRAMRGPEWQPIETAPKDGTEILLYAGPQTFEGKPVPERNTSGHWLSEEGYIREHRDLDGRWTGQDESEGYEGWLSWDGGFTEENPPTHWMPRPVAPSGNEGNGGAS